MKQRVLALCLIACLLLGCAACRIRVDLTQDVTDDEGTATTTHPIPESNDEMAAEAWQIYSNALKAEEAYTTFELVYEGRQTVGKETAVTKARVVRVQEGDAVSLLIESESGDAHSRGYFADGIGYFDVEDKKYWMPTDEDAVYETLGFSESEDLSEAMFSQAITVKKEDGSVTVSCPLSGDTATQFARMFLGDVVAGSTVTRAEAGVTVDAAGNPVAFTTAVTVDTMLYGTVSVESENRYVAVGETVVLTPPNDLDTYSSIIE